MRHVVSDGEPEICLEQVYYLVSAAINVGYRRLRRARACCCHIWLRHRRTGRSTRRDWQQKVRPYTCFFLCISAAVLVWSIHVVLLAAAAVAAGATNSVAGRHMCTDDGARPEAVLTLRIPMARHRGTLRWWRADACF